MRTAPKIALILFKSGRVLALSWTIRMSTFLFSIQNPVYCLSGENSRIKIMNKCSLKTLRWMMRWIATTSQTEMEAKFE